MDIAARFDRIVELLDSALSAVQDRHMNLTLGEVLYKIVDGICVETRALLTTPDTVPKSSIDHFLARAEILIAAFEQAAQIGAKPGYGIRDLSSETQSQHVMAKVYLDRLRKISA